MKTEQLRNQQIFAACIAGSRYGPLALEHKLTEARVEQIFQAEARRQHPALVASVGGGQGFRARFLAALKKQQEMPT